MKKRYVIFDALSPWDVPFVARIEKENLKSYSVIPAEIDALPGEGCMTRRVSKDKVVAVIEDEITVVRAIYFMRLLANQHRAVVRASREATAKGVNQCRDLLRAKQKEEESNVG